MRNHIFEWRNYVHHSLVKVAEITAIKNRRISFVTANSRHGPWPAFNGTCGEVPESYILDAIFSTNLLVFAVRKRMNQVIIPLTKDGNLDSERDREPYWNYADVSYRANKGKGGNTPQNLWEYLDSSKALMRQVVQWQSQVKSSQVKSSQVKSSQVKGRVQQVRPVFARFSHHSTLHSCGLNLSLDCQKPRRGGISSFYAQCRLPPIGIPAKQEIRPTL